jgi:hypothetical protein
MGPNIYPAIVHNLHRKVREILDQLDLNGQIDRDEFNAPHVLQMDTPGPSVIRCIFIRNGRPENFVLHTRKQADPFRSWKDDDGYKRKDHSEDKPETSRKERDRRRVNPFESIMEQILSRR